MTEQKPITKELVKHSTFNYFEGDALATDVWVNKYALKDKDGNFLELNPRDMHKRLSKELARIESKYPNSISEEEIFHLLDKFKYVIPGGSILYGLGNNGKMSSLGNCIVIGNNHDSYGGIFQLDQEQTQLMKARAGVGHDISHLRPKSTPVNNTIGSSVGVVPFMERYSNSTQEVSQDNRRGALMLTIHIKHPDVKNFIKSKLDLSKINGANISVKITDEFMSKVKKDEDFIHTFPINSKINIKNFSEFEYDKLYEVENEIYIKKVKARDIWDLLVECNLKSAEPGILFWDTIINESPSDCYEGFETTSTNPCLSGDTWVTTEEGPKQIKDLVDKGKVKLLKDGKFYETTEEGFFETGYKPVYELELENGYKIKATDNHKFLTNNKEWVELKNLKIEDLLVISNNTNIPYIPYSPIVSIKYIGEEIVYDCTVPEVSSFDANGIIVHNCGEIPLCPYDSCRLMSLNLYGFIDDPYTNKAKIDWKKLKKYSYRSQKLIDDVIDLEEEKINKIIKKINQDPEPPEIKLVELKLWEKIKDKLIKGRRTGLSIIGIGDGLAALGLRYGSDKSNNLIEKVYKTLAINSYIASIDMAKERGKFPIWDYELEKDNPFLNRIISKLPEGYKKCGRRNISNLTIPPSGSLSILGRITSGIEPVFSLFYTRRRKVNPDSSKIDFIDSNNICWEEYNVLHPKLIEWYNINYPEENINELSKTELKEIIDKSPYYKSTANEIDPIQKIKMQGKIQKWIDHSISVTHNLPKGVSKDYVNEIYKVAYKYGCKGCTIYVDGSREGILTTEKQKSKFVNKDAYKRPKELICDVFNITYKGEKYLTLVGLVEGVLPYEVFALKLNGFEPIKIKQGYITKIKKGYYNLLNPNKEVIIENITEKFEPREEVLTRLCSTSLRHGINIKFVIEQLQKAPTELNDFSKVIARTLKRYIKEGDKSTLICPDCNTNNLVFVGGCVECINCGYSGCS